MMTMMMMMWSQTIETEQRSRDEAREQHQASERRAMVLAGEIEELRAQVEACERARKIAEGELHEASDRVSELSTSASTFSAQKRKLENDITAMHVRRPAVLGWRRDVVASVVASMNEVTVHWARLVLGWVTVFGRVYHHGV